MSQNAGISFFVSLAGSVFFINKVKDFSSEWIVDKGLGGVLGWFSAGAKKNLMKGQRANSVINWIFMFFIFWAIVAIIMAFGGVHD